MRPSILNPLFSSVTVLPGVGPRMAARLEKVAGPLLLDLCWHLPSGIIDRSHQPTIAEAKDDELATLTVTVDQHIEPRTRKLPYKVRCRDDTGFLTLTYFHPQKDYLIRTLEPEKRYLVSGRVQDYRGEKQIVHPDLIVPEEKQDETNLIQPVYPSTEGLFQKTIAKAIEGTLEALPELPEWHDQTVIDSRGWREWRASLVHAHTPKTEAELSPADPARHRLAYDELLANQLALMIIREHAQPLDVRPIKTRGSLLAKVFKQLPFELTGDQRQAIRDIRLDLADPRQMTRLLQGDVGSGKTMVALAAMVDVVDGGRQAALMVPTEILARQHIETITSLTLESGLRSALLTGSVKGKERKEILEDLENGSIDILVGTHALFQEGVKFRDLGIAIVDEQHRFGVHQRLRLSEKGRSINMLVMTATPIPRTLALTLYGDMDVSRIEEKPAGRKPITTSAVPLERIEDVVASVGKSVADGNAVYWVCPLVEESDVITGTAAETRFNHLKSVFGPSVGLMHGRLSAEEKDAAIRAFRSGETQILVATTVIEVGVDVPHANIIVIEHAERFGLAQLHQLRGRVGRGSKASSCLLLYKSPLGDTAKRRLDVMRRSNDGFLIAEEDLKIRGTGDVLGSRQSGQPFFRLASLDHHLELLQMASDDARLILQRDPNLTSERSQALRMLLYLFRHDESMKYLRSG